MTFKKYVVIKNKKALTPEHLFANLKIKYYEKITMQM